jgi:hypothetical protein
VSLKEAISLAMFYWHRGEPIPLDVMAVLNEHGYTVDILETRHRG